MPVCAFDRCGKEFEIIAKASPTGAVYKRAMEYCTVKCRKNAANRRIADRKREKTAERLANTIIKCLYCDQDFSPMRASQKFCCVDHSRLFYNEYRSYLRTITPEKFAETILKRKMMIDDRPIMPGDKKIVANCDCKNCNEQCIIIVNKDSVMFPDDWIVEFKDGSDCEFSIVMCASCAKKV
jgi:hypothetical protein